MKIKLVVAVAGVLLSVVGVAACGDSDNINKPVPSAQGSAKAPTADKGGNEFVQAVVDETWDGTSEADRDDLCLGTQIFSKQELAELMQDGAGDDASVQGLDWDAAAEMLITKCEDR